ncbi:ABC transporter permease subunit [Methylomarinum vadi]|uniref:ABC transporter permease subunit n=1 Tax=Methylomarinum vadi TaxID=438855 RepID=UPI0004DFA91F|nr:ABC transporter permease subunit [Methylomarinum vadi]
MKKAIPILLFLLATVAFVSGCRKNDIVITRLDDAKQASIGVMTGSTGEAITLARFPQAQVKSFDDIMDAVAALKSGQLDAIVTAFPAALQVSKKNPEFTVLSEPLDHENTAIAVRKGNDELLATLNRIITELKNDGTLASMKKRWFKPDLSPYEELNITLPSEGTPLKIGVSATREPFSFVDKNGRVSGHDGEFARIIGAKLHRPVEFYNMKFMALIPALQSGKVDIIVTGMTATKERSQFVDFTQPYYANAQVMLVKRAPSTGSAGDPEKLIMQTLKLSSVADLENKRIGVLLGSAHDTYATKHYPDATILQYKSPADVALAVKTGKVDVALYDAEPLREIMRDDDSFALLGGSLFDFDVAAGFKKDNQQLRNRFNEFLAQIKQNGIYADMLRRWMERRDIQLPVIANSQNNGVLVVGVSDAGMPFVALRDNQWVGFDIELSERFAAYLGKKIKFDNMDFGSLIAAVSTSKADIIISSIYVTEERKKQIDFSNPYFKMGTRVFALKKNVVTDKLMTVADLSDKRIGVLLGSVYDTYATEHYPNAQILQYKSPSDLVLAVRSGKIDAGIYNRANLIQILREDQELALLGEPVLSIPVGMGFNQNNDVLREQFNAFLKQIQANGVLNDVVDRWIEQGNSIMPEIANAGSNGVLIVGIVSDKGLPFAVIQNNELIGFDIELAERFGAYIGKKVKYADMEFGNLIAAVSAGKIDMIDSTLMITDERKTRIDFSEPYFELKASVFALKKNLAAYDSPSDSTTASSSFLTRIANSFYSNIIHEQRYLLIWDGLKTTVVISIFATLFGTLTGALVCFMRMSKRPVLNLPAKIYINLLRGMPVLVLLMLIFYVVFASVNISPVLVAIIAFGLNFGAYVSEMFRTGIESIDKGQTEAGIAMGFTKLQTFIFIVLPQAVQRILPVYKGEFISLVKMTSIVGYIAVQDLTKASDIIRARTFDAFFPLIMVAILYFVIAWVLMLSLEYLERITDPKYKRRKGAQS